MDAVIKVRPEELTDAFLQQLKQLATHAKRIEIRFDGVDAANNLSEAEIENRVNKLSENKTVSFTFDELQDHIQKITG